MFLAFSFITHINIKKHSLRWQVKKSKPKYLHMLIFMRNLYKPCYCILFNMHILKNCYLFLYHATKMYSCSYI
ncbi:hypothetical protein CQA56_23045 [Escherichia coli]|uniref:Uncharacterized protein n=1 Tax=Escherichia coli TaxID=562 RepID=A0A3U0WKT8_ECOLX|nr:hypothetical protein DV870_23045 [Escherichia coli]EBX0388630.1 hypothetical protein [Salmonella enterica subsp. enterica serovar Newport]EFJ54071.1 hypothetical protein HMPREF9549_04532 [Escherichia coli MS 185-1]EFJ92532.1 hypothetical protein HMPREF9531_02379 [Escherichia coli MS 45-1]EFU50254.1 hypothetical protein HMPREF9544_04704 [Escherichia coli MS 153-1]ESD39610.1 hypothetical protein HMPREF1603_01466 [Escherichia coli 907892]